MSDERLFIASIGTADYGPAEYFLGSNRCTTQFAPVATAQLLGLQGRALILVTDQARQKWYAQLAGALQAAGLQPEAIGIPDGRSEDEILAIFSALQERVPAEARIILDVTFALRHLPFVYLATLVYLVALRGVQVQGVYYGAYELRDADNTAPIIEITSLFQLLQWYHALASARARGDWTQVASNLRADVGRLFRRGLGDRDLSRLQEPARRLAEALAMGLPIEAGLRAADLRAGLPDLTEAGAAPAARLALAALRDQLPSWAIDARPLKRDLRLTTGELERQLRVADWYAQHHEHDKALAIMREVLVSALMLRNTATERWLDYGRRKPFEDTLRAFSERAKVGVATDVQKTLASLWDATANKRNQFAHAGMTEEEVSASDAEVIDLLERARGLLGGAALEKAQPVEKNRLLLTPLGLSPGVLYSGLIHAKPDHVLIVTSRDAEGRISEALQRAAYPHPPRLVIRLDEPYLGYREVDGYPRKKLDALFAAASEVFVNVTGGTTVMQYAVDRLADRARRLGTPVRRVALIDRRPLEDQRANPYVLGEIVWLDEDKDPSPSPAA
jgi:hypothetical protein